MNGEPLGEIRTHSLTPPVPAHVGAVVRFSASVYGLGPDGEPVLLDANVICRGTVTSPTILFLDGPFVFVEPIPDDDPRFLPFERQVVALECLLPDEDDG